MAINFNIKTKKAVGVIISALGALGVAMQNIVAVVLFLRSTLGSFTTITKFLSNMIHGVAIGFGGISSGMVNFYMNVDLLESFIERMSANQNNLKLNGWRKFRYYAGTFVFVVTGILFGATAFTFGMATPYAVLAIAAGILVSIIMTIQEVETWLESFKPQLSEEDLEEKTSLYYMFTNWKNTLTKGKAFGHFIAAGNVIALSLLFTLGLTEVLISIQVTAVAALLIAVTVSFTLGAFTEFYFYNFFLADFCNHLVEEWQKMKVCPHPIFGLACIAVNAFVNGALTYSGVGLLAKFLVTAGFTLAPVSLVIGVSMVCAIFSGSASFLLGMKFWIPKTVQPAIPAVKPIITTVVMRESNDETPCLKPGLAFFTRVTPVIQPTTLKHTSFQNYAQNTP